MNMKLIDHDGFVIAWKTCNECSEKVIGWWENVCADCLKDREKLVQAVANDIEESIRLAGL